MNDLTTIEGRTKAIQDIENSFLKALKLNGIELAPFAACTVKGNTIQLGISAYGSYAEKGYKFAFASEIHLHSTYRYLLVDHENEISFGSSGSFSPSSSIENYWRTIHAASILKNWGVVCEIVNTHCKLYSDLCVAIYEANKNQSKQS